MGGGFWRETIECGQRYVFWREFDRFVMGIHLLSKAGLDSET